MKSEHTKNLKKDELKKLKEEVERMDDDKLAEFRNGFNPDAMGFYKEEGAVE